MYYCIVEDLLAERKTTLLRMLAGLETIDSGQVIYNGEILDVAELEKQSSRLRLSRFSTLSSFICLGRI